MVAGGLLVAGCQKNADESTPAEATNAAPPAEMNTNLPAGGMHTNAAPMNTTNGPVNKPGSGV